MTRSQEIGASTLVAVNQALSDAYNLLLPIAQEEKSERRKGPAWKACTKIERAQRLLVKDTRP